MYKVQQLDLPFDLSLSRWCCFCCAWGCGVVWMCPVFLCKCCFVLFLFFLLCFSYGGVDLWLWALLFNFVHSSLWIFTSSNCMANIAFSFSCHYGLTSIKKSSDNTEFVRRMVWEKVAVLIGVRHFLPVNPKLHHFIKFSHDKHVRKWDGSILLVCKG